MVLWRWWPMGGMLVVRLRRRMDSVRYQLVRRISAESGTRRESKTLSVQLTLVPDDDWRDQRKVFLGRYERSGRRERRRGTRFSCYGPAAMRCVPSATQRAPFSQCPKQPSTTRQPLTLLNTSPEEAPSRPSRYKRAATCRLPRPARKGTKRPRTCPVILRL